MMDSLDLEILKAVQDGIKMTERPYQALGEELGISEAEVIERLKGLQEGGHCPQVRRHHRT